MRKPRILIADDDTMVRIGLKTVINWEENGFVLVGEAANGLEAMQLVQEKKPDIVITDIKMPGMDGHRAHPVSCGSRARRRKFWC